MPAASFASAFFSPASTSKDIKAPRLLAEAAEVWLVHLEHEFQRKGVWGDATKFAAAFAALDGAAAQRVFDLATARPTVPDRYDQLKARLVGAFLLSTMQRCDKLVSVASQLFSLPEERAAEIHSIMLEGNDGLNKWALLKGIPVGLA